jgi:hypothetical protein
MGASIGTFAEFANEQKVREQRTSTTTTATTTTTTIMTTTSSMHFDIPSSNRKPLRVSYAGHSQVECFFFRLRKDGGFEYFFPPSVVFNAVAIV